MTSVRSLGAATCLILGVISFAPDGIGAQEAALDLQLVRRWPVPIGVVPSRVSILGDSTLLVRDRSGSTWRAGRSENLVEIVTDDSPRIALETPDGTRMVDLPSCISTGMWTNPLLLTADGLVGLARDTDGLDEVIAWTGMVGSCRHVDRRVIAGEGETYLHLDRAGAAVIASFRAPAQPPLRIAIDDGLTIEALDVDLPRVDSSEAGADERRWVGLPLVPLDRGFLRVYADLRSHARMVVRYDDDLALLATTELKGSVGFSAALPSRRLLAGLDGSDLVLYEWSWRR